MKHFRKFSGRERDEWHVFCMQPYHTLIIGDSQLRSGRIHLRDGEALWSYGGGTTADIGNLINFGRATAKGGTTVEQ